MRYTNESVVKAKKMLISRMSYLISLRLKYTTSASLARQIDMGLGIVSKIKNNITHGISFDAVLVAAERLGVHYELSMSFDGEDKRKVNLKMEDIESSRIRTLGEVQVWDHRNTTH